MDDRLDKVSLIVSSVSALQIIKMAYFVFLDKYGLEDDKDDELSFEKAIDEALSRIAEVDKITETAEQTVIKLVRGVDAKWELKTERLGSFTRYLVSTGTKVNLVTIEDQKAISYQIIGEEMTVDEMLDIVG